MEGMIFIILGILLFIGLIFFIFNKELNYKCPHCGSKDTVQTNNSDGEYFDMEFHCKHCNKDFTIESRHIGGWPD